MGTNQGLPDSRAPLQMSELNYNVTLQFGSVNVKK